MALDVWTLNTLLSKWLIYGGSAAAIGGTGIAGLLLFDASTRQHARNTLLFTGLGCAVGLFAIAANFFLQVGAFADNGVSGLFDIGILVMLWESAVGDATAWRTLGFVALLIPALILLRWPQRFASAGTQWLVTLSVLAGIGSIGASFATVGHSVEYGLGARLLVVIHVLGVMWWIGALIPLCLACSALPVRKLHGLMHCFGRLAAAILAVLLTCGTVLLALFLRSPVELFTTPYGLAMTVKIGAVLVLLGLAALHKWRLVPQLADFAAALRLKASIGIEIVLAALILALTAVLSTALGPPDLA